LRKLLPIWKDADEVNNVFLLEQVPEAFTWSLPV